MKRASKIDASMGGEEDEEKNIWHSILHEVSQRDDVKEGHIICLGISFFLSYLGDNNSGKKSLIKMINKNVVKLEKTKGIH
jgi:uncharacterized protein YwlG (UPF0340 family)